MSIFIVALVTVVCITLSTFRTHSLGDIENEKFLQNKHKIDGLRRLVRLDEVSVIAGFEKGTDA